MGLRIVLDSNVVIYEIGGKLAIPLPQGTYFVSVISKIELLSFSESTSDQTRAIEEFLESITVVDLTEDIVNEAITLRKTCHLKLPDAIIAATAIVTGSELLTNDANFMKISGIQVSAPQLKG